MESRIVYFEKPGRENTDAVMEIVKKRAEELGIRTVVVASYRGFTAEKAVKALEGMNIVVIAGFREASARNLAETFAEGDEKLITSGAKVLVATHLFSGVARAVRRAFDTAAPEEIIARTLRIVGTGIKVGVECAMMAADAGLAGTDEDIIAIAGTRAGADTAIVLRPAFSHELFDMRVKEILCKPREG